MGVATDKAVPLWDEAVEVLASGVVKVIKLISFTAGFDRTCVVSVSGDGVAFVQWIARFVTACSTIRRLT